jgi:hypothetical protein
MRPAVVSLGRPSSVRSPATALLLLAAALLPNAVLSVESSADPKREYTSACLWITYTRDHNIRYRRRPAVSRGEKSKVKSSHTYDVYIVKIDVFIDLETSKDVLFYYYFF